MAEDFDVFRNLKKLSKKNILDEFKAKLADAYNKGPEETDDLEIDSLLSSFEKNAQTESIVELQNEITNEVQSVKDIKATELLEKEELSKTKGPEIDENQPIARRTRRTFQQKKAAEQSCSPCNSSDQNQPTPQRGSRRRRGGRKSGQNTSSDNNLEQTERGRTGRRGRNRQSSVMHARRVYLAEKAARATQIDYVDLVSSPVVRVEGFCNLDSDEEPQYKDDAATAITIPNLNALIDEDNPEVLIKIKWNTNLETWKVRKYEKFHGIFQKIAQRENTSIENILLNIENRIIGPDDTPDSIDYKVYQFLSGRILEKAFSSPLNNTGRVKERSKNCIVLKVQSDKWKRPKEMDLLKTDKIRILYIKCSEELNVPIEKLKLSFDGETLDYNDTPLDLELEGNEIIDVNLKK